jgi:4-amino-4-deoxy-L-arabinose transferase-like glycosyltransferase
MTFFVALSLWLATRALRQHQEANDRQEKDSNPHVSRSRLKLLLLAAFAAGLAAATKYNGVLVLAAPLAALWALRQRHWPSNAGLMIGTAVLGFLIGCPYSILSFREFWGDGKNLGFAYELFVHPRLGSGEIFQNTGNGWWYHLTFNLPFVMTVPVLAVVLAGLFATVAAVRDKDHDRVLKKALILPITAFSLLYFFSLGFSQVRFLRYTLPLLPAFCVFAVPGVEFLSQKFFSPARASLAERVIAGALCTFLLIATFGVLVPLTQADPRDRAIAWLNENGGAAPVTVGLAEPPWFFTPPLSPSAGLRVPALSQPPGADDRYMLRVTGFDAQRLKAEKPRWFVMSAFERRDKKRLDNATFKPFMRRLESLYEVKATFKNRSPFILPGRSFVPHDFLYTNPKVNVYRLKE